MSQVLWRTISGEGMVSEPNCGLRLIVVPTKAPHSVRFVVENRFVGDGVSLPVLSGYRESVTAAMQAAEEAVSRLGGSW